MSKPEQLITEHIDIWTSSILAKSTAGRGSSKKYELYGIKKLRELILELAVRGKLVSQDANDEPASVLLEKIAAEKAELVKEGKVRKPKRLAEISEDEKLFNLPKNWVWCRLQDIGYDLGQKKPDLDFTYIDVGSINKEFGVIEKAKVLNVEDAPSRARKLVKKGTVVYSTVRPYLLNIAIVGKDFIPEPIASTAFAIVHPLEGMSNSFIYRYLRSPSFISYVESCQTGIAYPAINDKQFFNGLIPVPPTNEQQRIVAKVDELMLLCDQLEQQTEASIDAHATLVDVLLVTLTDSADANELTQNWARVSEYFDSLFTTEQSIEALKQTILQLAVMGKLVPQNPVDEPASVLLEKIKKVKHSEIRKNKSLPEISEDEKLYTLPDSWEWARLGDISSVGTGATPSRTESKYWSSEDVSWVSSGETSEPFIFNTKEKISYLAIKETNVSIYPPGTLIVAMYGQGKTRGQITELKIEAGTNQACAAIRMVQSDEQHRHYIKLFFWKSYEEIRSNAAGGAQPNLNVSKITSTVLPLPPLAEQHRIIAKVDELMKICDQLKDQLQHSQVTQIQITDALIEKALA